MYESPNTSPNVRRRHNVEKRIVKRVVADLLAAGYELAVYDGEEWYKRTTDPAKLHKQLMETDEDRLFVYKVPGPHGKWDWFGWVFFVYGNDGNDVISDYTVNLEADLKAINEWTDTL